jgi:hypothetical protein
MGWMDDKWMDGWNDCEPGIFGDERDSKKDAAGRNAQDDARRKWLVQQGSSRVFALSSVDAERGESDVTRLAVAGRLPCGLRCLSLPEAYYPH